VLALRCSFCGAGFSLRRALARLLEFLHFRAVVSGKMVAQALACEGTTSVMPTITGFLPTYILASYRVLQRRTRTITSPNIPTATSEIDSGSGVIRGKAASAMIACPAAVG
jgi:hypothetical protein